MEEQGLATTWAYCHPSTLRAIARLEDPHHSGEKHRLLVSGRRGTDSRPGWHRPAVDLQSLEYLVRFLDSNNADGSLPDSVAITELELYYADVVSDRDPSDGCLNVLKDFFSRSNTSLTKVTLHPCYIRQIDARCKRKLCFWLATKHAPVATVGMFRVDFACGRSPCILTDASSESNLKGTESIFVFSRK
jgi:hypothetical protein